MFDTDRPEQVDDYYYALVMLFVPFKDEDDLLEPGETPKEAFSRLQNDELLAHHEKLQKMLEASSKKRETKNQSKMMTRGARIFKSSEVWPNQTWDS